MNEQITILAVDDEPEILDIVEQFLSGFGFEVKTASDAETARQHLEQEPIDIAILDVNLPGEDGLSLAKSLKDQDGPSILMLTAMAGLDDRLRGLTSGADDYLVKPFEPRELLARVRSLARRLPSRDSREDMTDHDMSTVAFGNHELDLKAHVLRGASGSELPLTSMEFDLLKAFADHPNRVLNRGQLAEFAHHREWSPDDRSIDIRVARLRKKVEDDPTNPKVIVTVRGMGYKFIT